MASRRSLKQRQGEQAAQRHPGPRSAPPQPPGPRSHTPQPPGPQPGGKGLGTAPKYAGKARLSGSSNDDAGSSSKDVGCGSSKGRAGGVGSSGRGGDVSYLQLTAVSGQAELRGAEDDPLALVQVGVQEGWCGSGAGVGQGWWRGGGGGRQGGGSGRVVVEQGWGCGSAGCGTGVVHACAYMHSFFLFGFVCSRVVHVYCRDVCAVWPRSPHMRCVIMYPAPPPWPPRWSSCALHPTHQTHALRRAAVSRLSCGL